MHMKISFPEFPSFGSLKYLSIHLSIFLQYLKNTSSFIAASFYLEADNTSGSHSNIEAISVLSVIKKPKNKKS